MLARDTEIYHDTLLFADELMKVTIGFRKEYRRTIAERLENKVLEMTDHIVLANADMPRRAGHLWRFAVCMEQVNALLDIAVRRRQLSPGQEAHLARIMDGIGRQATRWRKAAEGRDGQGVP